MAIKDCHCDCVQDLLRRVAALEKYVPLEPRQRIEELPVPTPISNSMPKSGVAIENQIEDIALTILGRCEPLKDLAKGIRKLRNQHGIDAVIEAFTTWSECQVHPYPYGRPVDAFIRTYRWDAVATKVASPNLDKVANEIAYLSENNVLFSPNQKMVLTTMIQEYGPEAVVLGFKDFYSKTSNDERPWVAKNFIEKGSTFILTMVRKKQELNDINAALLEAREKGQAEVQSQLAQKEAELLAESEIEEEL